MLSRSWLPYIVNNQPRYPSHQLCYHPFTPTRAGSIWSFPRGHTHQYLGWFPLLDLDRDDFILPHPVSKTVARQIKSCTVASKLTEFYWHVTIQFPGLVPWTSSPTSHRLFETAPCPSASEPPGSHVRNQALIPKSPSPCRRVFLFA